MSTDHRRNYAPTHLEPLTQAELDVRLHEMVEVLHAQLNWHKVPALFVLIAASGVERAVAGTMPPEEIVIVLGETLSELAGTPLEGRVVVEQFKRTVQ